jgi:hypothetical protein
MFAAFIKPDFNCFNLNSNTTYYVLSTSFSKRTAAERPEWQVEAQIWVKKAFNWALE